MTEKTEKIYVRRDANGAIVELSLQPRQGFELCLAVSEKSRNDNGNKLKEQLGMMASTDLSLARVLEDLIDLMMKKEMICFTDLPDTAQKKLLERRSLRSQIQGLNLLSDELDEII